MARRRVPFRFGPPAEPPPKPKPFTVLAKPRVVPASLPSDLVSWYSRHEGVGVDASPIHSVKLCKLEELKPLEGLDLAPPEMEVLDPALEGFRGLRIAVGVSTSPIVYVLGGNLYRFGTVFAMAPGGRLVLEANHKGWLERLSHDDWIEWGLAQDQWPSLQKGKSAALKRHFERLNPG